jgi:hypothetical protein
MYLVSNKEAEAFGIQLGVQLEAAAEEGVESNLRDKLMALTKENIDLRLRVAAQSVLLNAYMVGGNL